MGLLMILTYVGDSDEFNRSAGEPGGSHMLCVHYYRVGRVPVLISLKKGNKNQHIKSPPYFFVFLRGAGNG